MDRIKVTLMNYTPKEVLIEAMSMPYQTENFKNMSTEDAMKKIKAICVDKKHGSVLEHITFNFKIEGISRLSLQELARHRMASYTVQSTRFTLPDKSEAREILHSFPNKDVPQYVQRVVKKYVVIPEYIKDSPEEATHYEAIFINFKRFIEALDFYNSLISAPRDKVKYYLPESWRTNLVMSINIRSLRNFLYFRMDKQAHFEIRHLASLMYEQIPSEYKVLFEDLVEKN